MARRISDENGPNADPWVSEIKIGETTITSAIAADLVALTEAEGGGAASDIAYDATSWNGNTDAPTKNTIRDLVEVTLPASYMKLISTTTISSPVNYVDFDLPSGFSAYRLHVSGAYTDTALNLQLIAVFSQDGGTTWLTDYNTDFVGYAFQHIGISTAPTSGDYLNGVPELNLFSDGDDCATHIDMMVYPGSATRFATMVGTVCDDGGDIASGSTGVALFKAVCKLNTARCDAIRICPYDDPNAITPALVIEAGTFTLYGVL